MIFIIFLLSGAAGIAYTAHAISKIDDFFDEVYTYDRDSHT